jgi:hypothetical protein
VWRPGTSDTAYLALRYTTGTARGNGPLTLPGTRAPGTYAWRRFSNNGYTRLSTSTSCTVTAPPVAFVPGRVAIDDQ